MRKEHPILFSTPMVQAILEGKKSITRRIIKIPEMSPLIDDWQIQTVSEGMGGVPGDDDDFEIVNGNAWIADLKCRYGKKDDILWVREKWGYLQNDPSNGLKFRTEIDETAAGLYKWRPSIHMPKEAARIWLEVLSIKVERLHDISDADIISEGVRVPVSEEGGVLFKLGEENSAWRFMPEQWQIDRHVENRGKEKYTPTEHDLLFAHWAELWCEINGRESWDANPWLWVIEFKVLSTTGKPLFKKLADVETV
jgi:hypothetical protein